MILNPILQFQTSISMFCRYRLFFVNHDIEYDYIDIEVSVFDIEQNVDIVVFYIDVNVDIGGSKLPEVQLHVRRAGPEPGLVSPSSQSRDSDGPESSRCLAQASAPNVMLESV